jgi:hypothetical protein
MIHLKLDVTFECLFILFFFSSHAVTLFSLAIMSDELDSHKQCKCGDELGGYER